MKYNAFPILLASTFLSTSAVAQTVPEINADYLNSLTGEKVTWKEVNASEMGAMEIAGKHYKATYHNIDNYDEIKDKSENISVVNPTNAHTDKYVGAAINNVSGNNYGNIDKKVFLNNKVTANLENNTGYSRTLNVYGGAISNQGEIGDIIADFIGNSVEATKSGSNANAYAYGGAIYNGVIDDNIASISYVTGDFIGNYAEGYGASGGAISNYAHSSSTSKVIPIVTIGNIFGNFIKNHATKNGGAIFNYAYSASGSEAATASINNIVGVFAENYATNGGAISNLPASVAHITLSTTNIGSIKGDFIGNHATANGGAISNNSSSYKKERAKIGNITGSFIKNYVISNAVATGGAIRNDGVIDNIIGNFFCNYIETTNIIPPYAPMIRGGAIYTSTDLTLSSDNDAHYFDGNYTLDRRGKIYNAIFIGSNSNSTSSITITFNTFNVSSWVINDNIEGLYKYNLSFTGNDTIDTELGTTTQYINMNNAIINAGEVKVENTTLRFGNYQHEDKTAKNWDGKGKFIASLNYDGTENIDADSVTSLTLNNAVFDISNGYLETIKLKKLTSTENTSNFIHLDVNVENMESDVINVKGDVDGGTKLIIHATSDKDIRGRGKILFAESFGDTKGGETSFEVARVYKSPYLYDVIYEGVENTSTPTVSKDNTWYFEMNDKENPNKEQAPVDPNPDVPNIDDNIPTQPLSPIEIAPEIIGFEALQSAGLSQTNGMVYNIMRKVGVNRLFCPGCGFYDYNWDGKAFHNAWVDTTYNGLTIEAPVEIDANVWGIEAGADVQHDLNNKLGIFASYRQGNYEMDGKGEKYYSTIGSEIDIDSYLAGLYYRYDHNNWYAFATVYGGMQNAEIKTDDGISADTDGIEFGGSVEGGYNYALTRTLLVTPSLGVFYSQINYDDATDSAGKTVEYNDLKQVEIEAGAKFAHTQYTDDGFYSLYVKPSVVQTLVDDDEIDVTELGKVDTVEDKTLGRVEIGGNYGFNDNWSAYGWANYTFGSDYDATALGAGVNYSW